jgi:peptide/nickel transport system substrate-binding protein
LLGQRSQEPDTEKRKALVWRIERIARGRGAADHLYGHGASCWQPHFKVHVEHENSIYINWRFDNVWLDK